MIYCVGIEQYSAYFDWELFSNFYIFGFNAKDSTERFSAKESTRCSCLSFCKFSFCLLNNSSQKYYEL